MEKCQDRRYDERRLEEGSNSTDSRKPLRIKTCKPEEPILAYKRMDEKRSSATVR